MRIYSLLFVFACAGLSAQISPDLARRMESGSSQPVLIQFRDAADLSGLNPDWTKNRKSHFVYQRLYATAQESQYRTIQFLQKSMADYRPFYVVNAIWAELYPDQIRELAGFPEISRISYDSPNHALPARDPGQVLTPRGPEITWGIRRVGADQVWAQGYEGQGVIVGGEDTGIKWDIPAIKESYRGWDNQQVDHHYNWYDAIHQMSPLSGNSTNPCGLNLREPCDDHGHGTHTVGTMVGLTNEHAIGMAPKAKWIGCRNMEQGNGSPSSYIECFEFFLAPFDLDKKNPKPELAPHVINNSWYCSLDEGCDTSVFPVMERAVENLRNAGVVVVVSAGNDGASCNTLNHVPAIYKGSFSVGAFEANNTISDFSSNGPVNNYQEVRVKPNVVAPGSDILSMLPDGSYASWNGTSMAGPHVAGLVALMISANPALAGQVERIESIIEETAEPFNADFDCFPHSGMQLPNNTYGFGLINAAKAVEKALLYVQSGEETSNRFSILPNPVRDELQVLGLTDNEVELELRDVYGRLLGRYHLSVGQDRIRVDQLVPGNYYLKGSGSISSRSFIKW